MNDQTQVYVSPMRLAQMLGVGASAVSMRLARGTLSPDAWAESGVKIDGTPVLTALFTQEHAKALVEGKCKA